MTAIISTNDGVDFGSARPLEALPFRTRAMPVWKRAMDIVLASTLLLVAAPFMVAIAAVVMADSRGGAFFGQTRVGFGGKCFTCWKFRSMFHGSDSLWAQLQEQNEANGKIFKLKDDPRRTRVGRLLRRTSLDELPQLWNVLRGEMSIVGPRPPLVREVVHYSDVELGRLAVAPGITGLWQVTLRGRHDFADMVRLDVEYAQRLSLLLDLRILLQTVPTVLFGKGSC